MKAHVITTAILAAIIIWLVLCAKFLWFLGVTVIGLFVCCLYRIIYDEVKD